RPARGGGARAGRSQSRRQDEDPRGDRRASPLRRRRPGSWPLGRPALSPRALIQTLSQAYGAAAAWRRAWYARDPSRRHRLERPVVSVGNLRVGGSGKTPIVEYIARLLVEQGERPAILTRGYGR